MAELTKILVVIEPDLQAQPALDKAKHLARLVDCELELMIAEYSAYFEDGNYYDPAQAKQLRLDHAEGHLATLESLAGPLRDQGLRVSVSTSWGNPAYKEIVRRATEINASLVVKSTHKHSKLARFFMANTDWELVRYCPSPLLLVKEQHWRETPVFIASVDPDHLKDKPAALDKKIIGLAQAFASASGGRCHLFHSIWKPPMAGLYPLDADRGQGEVTITKLADEFSIPRENCHCPDQEIVESLPNLVAALSADVVAIGAISRSRLDQVIIGNTAEKVLDELDCDVLVTKP